MMKKYILILLMVMISACNNDLIEYIDVPFVKVEAKVRSKKDFSTFKMQSAIFWWLQQEKKSLGDLNKHYSDVSGEENPEVYEIDFNVEDDFLEIGNKKFYFPSYVKKQEQK